jgi:hypothetical protein
MNPLVRDALMSAIRSGLKIAVGYLMAKGLAAPDQAVLDYLAAAILAGIGIGWSQRTVWMNRLKLVTALAAPEPLSESQIETQVKARRNLPAASSPKAVVPSGQP